MSNCSYSLHYCSPQKHTASWLTSFFSTSVLRQFSFSLQKYLLWLSRIVCTYIFHAAPGFLWRREGHQNINDSRSCCFSTTGTTTYLPLFQHSPPRPSSYLYSSQSLPRYICQQPPQLFALMEENHIVPWWKLLQKETNVLLFALPLHSLPGTHISMFSALIDHLSPIGQAVSTLFLRKPELLISSHVFYISMYLFRWMVLPQLI